MAALDNFKVDQAPAALAPTAAAHNRLVDLVQNIVGTKGVKVTVSEGRILIEIDPNTAANRLGGIPSAAASSSSSTATTLHYAVGDLLIDIDAAGIKLTKVSTGDYVQTSNAGVFTISNGAANKTFTFTPSTGVMMYQNGLNLVEILVSGLWVYNGTTSKLCQINFNDITHDVALREIDVCNSGSPGKMLVLGSAAY